jgi:hypothetical protein
MQPYAESFLSQSKIENNLINLGYSYLHGDKSGIENLEHDKYVLIGKEIPVERKTDHYQIKTSDINHLVKNIKEELFDIPILKSQPCASLAIVSSRIMS